jgi:hypothetical protein
MGIGSKLLNMDMEWLERFPDVNVSLCIYLMAMILHLIFTLSMDSHSAMMFLVDL